MGIMIKTFEQFQADKTYLSVLIEKYDSVSILYGNSVVLIP